MATGIDPNKVFNETFPLHIVEELDRRALLASGVERGDDFRKWNYKRYAYIAISCTSKNSLGPLICSQPNTIGDGTVNEKVGLDLYELEGTIRKQLPILKSVEISADGSSNVAQATMWTAKIDFDLFTLQQLDKAEKSFLRQGTVVKIEFGWANETTKGNSGVIEGEVTNFSFSANKDGSFSCSFEMVGSNSKFSSSNLEGSPELTEGELKQDSDESESDTDPIPAIPSYPPFVRSILLQHREAFNIQPGGVFTDEQAEDGKIELKGDNNEFALANIQETSGFFTKLAAWAGIDINDMFIPYITLGGLIDRINEISKNPDNAEIAGTASTKTIICNSDTTVGSFIPEMFSADPTIILFGDEMADYGKEGQSGQMLFGSKTSQFKLSDGNADLSRTLISIPYLVNIYKELKLGFRSYNEDDLKDSQTPPAVKDFLNEIFKTIEELSGGLYQLTLFQKPYDDAENVYIINKRVGYDSGNNESPYTFKVIGEDSIIRDMSLSTEFNAKLQAAAVTAARSGGQNTQVPAKLFENLYKDCDVTAESFIDDKNRVSKKQILKLKERYGQGFDESRVEGTSPLLKSYLIQNTPGNTDAEFGSVPYLINLSVTLDGIFGIPYFGRFTVDRLPAGYRGTEGSPSIFFTVTKINHSFDGQGDWSTQIEGVMNVKNNNG
jgi:hypothetical protein